MFDVIEDNGFDMIAEIEDNGVPEEQEQRQRFQIGSKNEASWAVKKIAKLVQAKTENEDTAKAEIARTQAWLVKENEDLDRQIGFFESILQEYHFKVLETDPKAKTIKLPYGALKIRAQQPEFGYDESILLPWVKKNFTEALVVKESVSKSIVKSYIKETGEVIPGVTIENRPPKFSVEVNL